MLESAERVVVLGRSGDAQQQLARALQEIGVEPLAIGDFDQLDPDQIRAQQPTVFLVSMDERTDAASMDRWQDLFDDGGIRAVFDDADVSKHLSGWDLARWARHLAAKVLGRQDVLPPVDASAERLGLPGAELVEGAARDESSAQDAALKDHPDFSSDPSDDASSHSSADPFDDDKLQLDTGDTSDSDSFSGSGQSDESGVNAFSLDDADGATNDDAFAELSAQFDAEQQRDRSEEMQAAPALDDLLRADADANVDIAPVNDSGRDVVETAEKPAAAAKSGLNLELAPLNDLPAVSPERSASVPDVTGDVSDYELEPISAEAAGSTAQTDIGGALAIVGGLGGPDAVRQLLAALPTSLPVPVLLWQHLDAGKHDRLAQQLGKASALPVYLARPGELARPGSVAVMTPAVGVEHDVDGWWFTQCDGGIGAALESALKETNSIALVLSGADGTVVGVAAAHHGRGGEVRVQNPDSCFDAVSAAALHARGVAAGTPTDLAALAASHWASATE